MIYPELSLSPGPELELYPPGLDFGFGNNLPMNNVEMQPGWPQFDNANVMHVDEVLPGMLSHPETAMSHPHGPMPFHGPQSLLFSGNNVVWPFEESGQYTGIASNASNAHFQQQAALGMPSAPYAFGGLESSPEPMLASQLFQTTTTFRSVDARHRQEQEQLVPPPPPQPTTIPLPDMSVFQAVHTLTHPESFHAAIYPQSFATPSQFQLPYAPFPAHPEAQNLPPAMSTPASAITPLPTPLFEDNATLYPSSVATTPEMSLVPELQADPQKARVVSPSARAIAEMLPVVPGWIHVSVHDHMKVACELPGNCGMGLGRSRTDCAEHLKEVHSDLRHYYMRGGKIFYKCHWPGCEGDKNGVALYSYSSLETLFRRLYERLARHVLEPHCKFNQAMCTHCENVIARAGACRVTRHRHEGACARKRGSAVEVVESAEKGKKAPSKGANAETGGIRKRPRRK
ncbi:hypothetical protein DENSPDRAFT_627876 [Dentipellis sp. KUC8613]|nr:hypothetical protein DENSPDRAFT_627876 [Dentipellis sp. KUC8613]